MEKNVYPCKSQFYYIKVGCKGVYITRTCFHDGLGHVKRQTVKIHIRCCIIQYQILSSVIADMKCELKVGQK